MGVILKGAILIDVQNSRVIRDHAVLIEGNKIVKICKQILEVDSKQHTVLDLNGKCLIPGIINLHQHYIYKRTFGPLWSQFKLPIPVLTVRAVKNALGELKQGITTARELGSVHNIAFSLKHLINHKYILGPRLFIAGQPLAITGSHASTLSQCVDGIEEFRKWTRERVKYVDWVKTFASFDPVETGREYARPEISKEEIQVICEEAHKAGKKVAAHAVGTQAIRNAVEGGVDTIEHGIYLNRELANMMRDNGTALVPTLTAYTETLNPHHNRGKKWIALHAPLVEPSQRGLLAALEAGVKIGMGLDSLGELGKEAILMQKVTGLSAIEILKIFTLNGAEILGLGTELGSIEEGKIADLVILDKNPLEDLANIESVNTVIKDGEVLPVDKINLSTRFESAEYHSLIPELLEAF